MTASNIASGLAGVTGFSSGSGNAYYFIYNTGGNPPLSTSEEDALATDAYFSFSLTPDEGTPLNIGQINAGVGHASAARTLNIYMVMTIDIGEQQYISRATFGEADHYYATSPGSATQLPATANFDLSILPPEITETATFKIYTYYNLISGDPYAPTTNHSIRLGNIEVQPIPEPTATALTLLGISACAFLRRKH